MYIRTKYHPASITKPARISVSFCESHRNTDAVIARSYISFEEIKYYNFSSTREEMLYALERFFELQRKAGCPLLKGTSPVDKAWDLVAVQLDNYDWLFVSNNCVVPSIVTKASREAIRRSMEVLTPPNRR
jgi:hypothetical protein